MKKIELRGQYGKGKFVLVDDEDYEYLSNYKWYYDSSGRYAIRIKVFKDTVCPSSYMHRAILFFHGILPTLDKPHVDHINRNRLDNRKRNLHFVTRRENALNKKQQPMQKRYKQNSHAFKDMFPRL